MEIMATLIPVFFMLGLGALARHMHWLSMAQKDGAYALIMQVLFPVMIFNLIVNTHFEGHMFMVVVYTIVVYAAALLVGRWLGPKLTPKYAHFAQYMLATNEGGSVALPLYLSIVQSSSNTVIFDIAGSLMCFFIIPICIARQSMQQASSSSLLKQVFSNSFILAFLLGMLLNFTGIWQWLEQSGWLVLYDAAAQAAIAPIAGIILFCLGYDLVLDKNNLQPLLRLAAAKTLFYMVAITGYFLLFPHLMGDEQFRIAVILYFMCPTGFGLVPIISPLFKNEKDASFASGFVSVYMIITLVVYAALVVLSL